MQRPLQPPKGRCRRAMTFLSWTPTLLAKPAGAVSVQIATVPHGARPATKTSRELDQHPQRLGERRDPPGATGSEARRRGGRTPVLRRGDPGGKPRCRYRAGGAASRPPFDPPRYSAREGGCSCFARNAAHAQVERSATGQAAAMTAPSHDASVDAVELGALLVLLHCRVGDAAEAAQPGCGRLSVLGSTGPKEAIGVSQASFTQLRIVGSWWT